MLSKYGRQFLAMPLSHMADWLQTTSITPNVLTLIGFVLTVLAATLLGLGLFRWGGGLLLVAALFDMLDGSLARASERTSTFGAFLDSTLDRYSESLTFLAISFYYLTYQPNHRTELILIFVTLVGSLMVSYTRARAEGLSVDCKVGILQRPERIIILIAGLITGWLMPALWMLAVLTNITALQRIYEVYWQTKQPST